MRLRIISPIGSVNINNSTAITINDLLQEIKVAFSGKLGNKEIQIFHGIRLHRIFYKMEDTLTSYGIITGDSITIKLNDDKNKTQLEEDEELARALAESERESIIFYSKKEEEEKVKEKENKKHTIAIPLNNGYVVLRESPDDNSCLFHSILYALHFSEKKTPLDLRKEVVMYIKSHRDEYSSAKLGRETIEEYCDWILLPSSWGGGIELSIFARLYGIEIASIDVETLRVDKFIPPPPPQYYYSSSQEEVKVKEEEQSLLLNDNIMRIYVFYSGIHYDSAGFANEALSPLEFDTTCFPNDHKISSSSSSNLIYNSMIELAKILRKEKRFTNLKQFTIRCRICQKALKGNDQAIEHSSSTGHTDFEEYK